MSLDLVGDLSRELSRVEDHIADEIQLWVELQAILYNIENDKFSDDTIIDELARSDLRQEAWENRRDNIKKELAEIRRGPESQTT